MAGPKRLSQATVKTIFRSKDPASALAKRHKVSVNLVYLIWARKIHKGITESIRKPIRKRQARQVRQGTFAATRIDVNRVAERVATLVLKALVQRLRGKA